MIDYQTALGLVLEQAVPLPAETVTLADALGRVAAKSVLSPIDVPSFRNSAMDGFAVRQTDLATASSTASVDLDYISVVAAGDQPTDTIAAAVQIMTGAPVPASFDAVIPVEDVTVEGQTVCFTSPARPNQNIRFPGEDVSRGQVLIKGGDVLTPAHIMLLAAVGVGQVAVHRQPAIQILSTGRELSDDYDHPLQSGQIFNSNAPYLMAQFRAAGFNPCYGGIIADDPATFEAALAGIAPHTVVISTGAVSKGIWDFVPESLNRLGAVTHFHRVNIRPGKPVLFAQLPNDSWFFGLPGNPVSAAIGARFFVQPLLRGLLGLSPEQPMTARFEGGFEKTGTFRQFLKARLSADQKGHLSVQILTGQESFKVAPLAHGNSWVVLEEAPRSYANGALVAVYPFDPRSPSHLIPSQSHKEAVLCPAL